jgi:hypothetical protein
MRLREKGRASAEEEGGNQSLEISWSIAQSDPRPRAHGWSETSPYFRKLNRQIPELKCPVTHRKQTRANCSNRQRIKFCKNEFPTQKLHGSARTFSSTEKNRPHFSNRELLGLEILQLAENKRPRPVLIANFEPNHFVVFQTGHSK